jgi:SAM-dependent methyltransferase
MKIYEDVLYKFSPELEKIVLENKDITPADKFWKTIHDIYHQNEYTETAENNRVISRTNDIIKIFKRIKKVPTFKSYLDIGCGNGSITEAIADELDIKNYHGMDLKDVSDMNQNNVLGGSKFIGYDGKKYPVVKADLVTCFQVLHHVKNLPSMIDFINSTDCKYLILREHNAHTDEEKEKLDFEHFIYGKVLQKNVYDNFDETYYSNYKSIRQWIKLFTAFDCKLVLQKKHTIDKIVYIVLKRVIY